MTRFVNYFAIAAFALVTMGMQAEAHADVVNVYVDNQTNPSHYGNAKSDGTLQVCVTLKSGIQPPCQARVLDFVSGAHLFSFNCGTGQDYHNVASVRFKWLIDPPDDADLLVVDQFVIKSQYEQVVYTSGTDNETGRCFSSQTSDANNSHCSGFTLVDVFYTLPNLSF